MFPSYNECERGFLGITGRDVCPLCHHDGWGKTMGVFGGSRQMGRRKRYHFSARTHGVMELRGWGED